MDVKRLVFTICWVGIWAGMLVGISYSYYRSETCKCSNWYFGVIFGIAKGISICINIALGLLLVQPLIRYVRVFYPVGCVGSIHRMAAGTFLVTTILHIVINSYIVQNFMRSANVVSSGVLLAIVIGILGASSIKVSRARHYTTFIVLHYICMISIVGILPAHASWCYFKYDDGRCISSGYRVMWWLLPIFLVPFLVTMSKFMPWIRGNRLVVESVASYPGNIIKIRTKHSRRGLGGKTVYISSGGMVEWHPYTFIGDDTIIMKVRGDWTRDLGRRMGIVDGQVTPCIFPELLFDGPFKGKDVASDSSLLVSTGIGLTSFVHFIKNSDLKNCYLMIIVRNIEELVWFWEETRGMGGLSVILFVTGIVPTADEVDCLPDNVVQISFHRPDWEDVLSKLAKKNVKRIYYAGVPNINLSRYTTLPVTKVTTEC